MSKRIVVSLAAIVVFGAALGFGRHLLAAHGLPPPDRLSLSAPNVSVPLTFFGGRPVVEVMINGKGPYRFIVDTGAAGTVISNELARELKLPALQHAQMGRPGSSTPLDAYVTKIDSLEIGGARAEGMAAVYSDLSRLTSMKPSEDAPRGVLSAVNFPGWIISIDFIGARLGIEKGDLPGADDRTTFEWTNSESIPTVPLRMADQTFQAHVDSGSGSGITLSTSSAARLKLTEKRLDKTPARFVDSSFPVTYAKLDAAVTIGKVVVTNPTIRYHDGSAPANIGQEVLHAFIVRVDAKNRRVQFIESK